MSNFNCIYCGHPNHEGADGHYDTFCDCPLDPSQRHGDLFMVIKDKWFQKIKSGEKTSEYREYKPYWITRALKQPFKTLTLAVGYQTNREVMTFEIDCIRVTREKNDLGLDKVIEIKLKKINQD